MEILLNRIQYLCDMYKLKFYALEKAAYLGVGSIKKWGQAAPSADRLLRVANYFGVSVDFLLGNTDNPKSHLSLDSADPIIRDVKETIASLDFRLNQYCANKALKVNINSDDIMNDPNLPHIVTENN